MGLPVLHCKVLTPLELPRSTPCWQMLQDAMEEVSMGLVGAQGSKDKWTSGTAGEASQNPPSFLHHQICENFRSISRKIYDKPNSIEELAELRDWMKGIPEKLVGLEVRSFGETGVGRQGQVAGSLVGLEVSWALSV